MTPESITAFTESLQPGLDVPSQRLIHADDASVYPADYQGVVCVPHDSVGALRIPFSPEEGLADVAPDRRVRDNLPVLVSYVRAYGNPAVLMLQPLAKMDTPYLIAVGVVIAPGVGLGVPP